MQENVPVRSGAPRRHHRVQTCSAEHAGSSIDVHIAWPVTNGGESLREQGSFVAVQYS